MEINEIGSDISTKTIKWIMIFTCSTALFAGVVEPFEMESRVEQEVKEVIEDKQDRDDNGNLQPKDEDGKIIS